MHMYIHTCRIAIETGTCLVVTAAAEYPLPILGEGAAKDWRLMVVSHTSSQKAWGALLQESTEEHETHVACCPPRLMIIIARLVGQYSGL